MAVRADILWPLTREREAFEEPIYIKMDDLLATGRISAQWDHIRDEPRLTGPGVEPYWPPLIDEFKRYVVAYLARELLYAWKLDYERFPYCEGDENE